MRRFGKILWRFMVIFSFIVNVILVITLIVVLLAIFDIKRNIAQPLIEGLHSSFVGLNDSTIDWTIPVRTSIPLDTSIPLNTSIPLQTDTIVTLTSDVAVTVSANITLPGVGNLNNAVVALSLPKDLQLPVRLDLSVPVNLEVPVDLDVPVSLDVRAVIPLSQTQLHDPVENLRLLFEPIVRLLGNLPDDFSEVGAFASQVLSGSPPDLLAETPYSQKPWPGYSITAGLNYTMANETIPPQNIPLLTGILPTGGIPALDQALRGSLYASGSPAQTNAQAAAALQAQGILPQYYDGSYAGSATSPRKLAEGGALPAPPDVGPTVDPNAPPTDVPGGDLGIIATPVPGG